MRVLATRYWALAAATDAIERDEPVSLTQPFDTEHILRQRCSSKTMKAKAREIRTALRGERRERYELFRFRWLQRARSGYFDRVGCVQRDRQIFCIR